MLHIRNIGHERVNKNEVIRNLFVLFNQKKIVNNNNHKYNNITRKYNYSNYKYN